MIDPKYITTVQQYGDTEDYFIEIPDEICQELNWQEGDTLDWQIEGKSIIIKNTDRTQEEHQQTYNNIAYNDWYKIKEEAIRQYS